jgi:hypothetical protein
VKLEIDPFEPDDASDAALDRLLAQATWAEPSPASTQRLRENWRAIRRRRMSMRIGAAMAVAASLAIVVGSFTYWMSQGARPHTRPPVFLNVIPDSPTNVKPLVARTAEPAPIVGQPLTIGQKLALLRSQAPPSRPPNLVKPAPPPAKPVVRDLSHLLADVRSPSADLRRTVLREMLDRSDPQSMNAFLGFLRDPSLRDEALAVLRSAPNPPVDRFVEQLNSPLLANRMAAAQALGEICDADVAGRLAQMVRSGTNRREAIAALLSSSKPIAARSLANASNGNRAVIAQIQAMEAEMSDLQ